MGRVILSRRNLNGPTLLLLLEVCNTCRVAVLHELIVQPGARFDSCKSIPALSRGVLKLRHEFGLLVILLLFARVSPATLPSETVFSLFALLYAEGSGSFELGGQLIHRVMRLLLRLKSLLHRALRVGLDDCRFLDHNVKRDRCHVGNSVSFKTLCSLHNSQESIAAIGGRLFGLHLDVFNQGFDSSCSVVCHLSNTV